MATKIKILMTAPGSPDHLTTYTYAKGDEYVLGSAMMPEDLALAFAEIGVVDLPAGMEKEAVAVFPPAKTTQQALYQSAQTQVAAEQEQKQESKQEHQAPPASTQKKP